MTIGLLKLVLFIPESGSLKTKRMVLHSLKARLRNNFNVAVSQVDDQDKWQKSTLAIVGVERSQGAMHRLLSNVVNFIERAGNATVIDYEMEMI
jgi:hypothetical protein